MQILITITLSLTLKIIQYVKLRQNNLIVITCGLSVILCCQSQGRAVSGKLFPRNWKKTAVSDALLGLISETGDTLVRF